ncbi:hypothetical protein [Marinomonas rhizomae]|nr:hypothetical protein [Marinomonas rhizomae]
MNCGVEVDVLYHGGFVLGGVHGAESVAWKVAESAIGLVLKVTCI